MTNFSKNIIVILIIIIAFSVILIFKINSTYAYDPEIYEEVYREFEQLDSVNNEENNNELENKATNITISKNQINDKSIENDLVIGSIVIPALKIHYPIIKTTTDEYLKVAPTKLAGPNPNEIGNFCIIGHNYWNDKFFSNLKNLNINDSIIIKDISGNEIRYDVYKKYEVNKNDLSCLEQNTNNKKEVTLITCTSNKSNRLILKCIESSI